MQVWTEIVGLGARIRTSDAVDDAVAVADETMHRARRNVERLVSALPQIGYRFEPGEGLVTFAPPAADAADGLRALESRIGLLPLSLRSWYLHVGRVSLMGLAPGWGFDYPDPLVVDAPFDYVHSELDVWTEDQGTKWDRGPFVLDIAPDYLHKANVSGGAPYGIEVPNGAADALLLCERHQTTFVSYLRIAFSLAGMPGWERGSLDGWAAPPGSPPPDLLDIARELEPL